MSRLLIYAIVFIEGFCSLGAEIIALRRLVPHVGSSIVVTAPTIGFFLLALALGYASGARVETNYRSGRRPQLPDRRRAGRLRAGRRHRRLAVRPPAAGADRLLLLHRRHPLPARLAARPDGADPDQPDESRAHRRGERHGALLVHARLLPRLAQPVADRHAMAGRFGGGARLQPAAGRRHAAARRPPAENGPFLRC